jgi:uncharacterized phage protein (TIGR02220 family)
MTNSELKQKAIELLGEQELARRFRSWITNLIRVARLKQNNTDSGTLYEQDTLTILSDLNQRTGSRFGATDSAKALIRARLQQGYQVLDFTRVHEIKCAKWLGDEKMEHNLRPSTLYRPSHFDEYLGEWYAMDRARTELTAKRQQAQQRTTNTPIRNPKLLLRQPPPPQHDQLDQAELAAKTAELNSRKWNEHASWLEFMLWTVCFPDAASLEQYPMPPRLRIMRKAPGMLLQIAKRKSPQWAETEYAEIKAGVNNG